MTTHGDAQGTGSGPLRAGLTAMPALLIFQFALGMWVNLYVSIPQPAPGYGMMGVMSAVWPYRWTGMTTRVRGVIAASSCLASML